MTVYKKYLKIASTYALLILAYSAIFLGLAIFAGTYNSTSTDYESMDVKVAIVNRDKNTELIKGFKEYIKNHGELVSLKDNDEALRDALFYRNVDYIMIIPENYTNEVRMFQLKLWICQIHIIVFIVRIY